jgi:hypothetical protein
MFPKETAATNPALNSDDWGRGYALATSISFEALERAVLRPQPDLYVTKAPDPGQINTIYQVPDFGAGTQFGVSILDGRYVDEVFDNDVGGSFHYLSFMKRMGSYMEKPLAIAALSVMWPPVANDFSRDQYTDGRNMLLNFRSGLPSAYDRLMAGILGSDTESIAPYVDPSKKDPKTKIVQGVTYTNLWAPTSRSHPITATSRSLPTYMSTRSSAWVSGPGRPGPTRSSSIRDCASSSPRPASPVSASSRRTSSTPSATRRRGCRSSRRGTTCPRRRRP